MLLWLEGKSMADFEALEKQGWWVVKMKTISCNDGSVIWVVTLFKQYVHEKKS